MPLNPHTLATLLAQKEVTRQDLCRDAGISTSYLSRILSGKVEVDGVGLLARIAERLNVEPETLTGQIDSPIRIAAPPHLWSAPLLNLPARLSPENALLVAPAGDQANTGGEALAALRVGRVDLALAFETPLNMVDVADVLQLGSIRTGTDYVRFLAHFQSPLLRVFDRYDRSGKLSAQGSAHRELGGPNLDTAGSDWQGRLTGSFHEGTIAGEYLQHLERSIPELLEIRPTQRSIRPWLDEDGRPVHFVIAWEPLSSAIIASAEGEMVDVLEALEGDFPASFLPPSAEYQLLVSRQRPISSDRLRTAIREIYDAVCKMNYFGSRSRIVLQHQPVVDFLIDSVPWPMDQSQRAHLRQLLAGRLGGTEFALRIRPEAITTGLL